MVSGGGGGRSLIIRSFKALHVPTRIPGSSSAPSLSHATSQAALFEALSSDLIELAAEANV